MPRRRSSSSGSVDDDTVTLNEIARAAGVLPHQTALNHSGSKAGVLPLAGVVFSKQVSELQADAVAGDVAGACARGVHALRGAGRRQYPVGGAGQPDSRGRRAPLPQGRANHQVWLEEMLGDRMPDDPPGNGGASAGAPRLARRVHLEALPSSTPISRCEQTELQLTDLARAGALRPA